jgi:hypothetical protein
MDLSHIMSLDAEERARQLHKARQQLTAWRPFYLRWIGISICVYAFGWMMYVNILMNLAMILGAYTGTVWLYNTVFVRKLEMLDALVRERGEHD